MHSIAVIGSTGSIGTQTLDVVRNNDDISVCALSCDKNIDLLEKQIREFHPEVAAVYDTKAAADLSLRIKDTSCRVVSGMEGLMEIATIEKCDMVVTAIVGMIGIKPTIAALKAGKDIALANKETLVCAGHIIMPLAKKHNVKILPVDSEHSAIFQCIQGNKNNRISKILLTASGGPFRGYSKEQLREVTLIDALKHPTWNMGKKITIDCATLANKGLEVMEAKWLFDVEPDDVQVVIHPQSIVHSMVRYEDGSVMAQMSEPDMRLPINYALFYPDRRYLNTNLLNFWDIKDLHFEKPDMETFPALRLAYDALKTGGSMPTVFNASNEIAVSRFLKGEISFYEIPEFIQRSMEDHKLIADPDEDVILSVKEELI
ncbi:MAG: 1-deoxy-D-xylulose-5-phosphate reductoisomerase [Lachnospiraceae bacterium]|nr:1-deoxy-D-xylulose-5-phosphate reductoisomerase [Lachnospiraceae bacterium]